MPNPNPSPSTWPDVATHAINAVVILCALTLIYFLDDAAARNAGSATMFGAATPVVVSLVGLYFGVVVGKSGLDQAKAANSVATTATNALSAERAKTSQIVNAVERVQAQLPAEHQALLDNALDAARAA